MAFDALFQPLKIADRPSIPATPPAVALGRGLAMAFTPLWLTIRSDSRLSYRAHDPVSIPRVVVL